MTAIRLLVVAMVFSLAACSSDKVSFKGIDLTGSKQDIGFTLTDVEGKERTLADFRGSYVLVFFGFTQCPDVCPTTLARALEVKKKLGPDGQKLKVVFISVDPERDTAELLRTYLQAFDREFVGLRGTPEQTKVAAKALNVFYEKVPAGSSYTINHTAITYILDAQGRLRLGMRHAQEPDDYVSDLRTLMKQAS
jgi:protein SCO1/2